ncbi:MAG: thioredoxin family protein [Chthoniobacteraceae bacterium]|jgi:thioredoxin-related protein
MMRTSRFPLALLMSATLLLWAAGARAQEANWFSDYSQATAQAKGGNSNILLDFTGSDWCPWCQRMDQEVLNTQAFQDYAEKANLALMLVDFPRQHSLPAEMQEQNNSLYKKYGVEGFPTFILTDKDGNEIGRVVGYLPGGPSQFIAALATAKKPLRILGMKPITLVIPATLLALVIYIGSRPMGMGNG